MRRSWTIPSALYFFSAATIAIALVQAAQIPMNALPEDSARLRAVPVSHFIHAVSGALFGILGPLQFGRVLAGRFGAAHRIMGRVFVFAGGFLALSSLSLLWHFPNSASVIVSGGRLMFGCLLGAALIISMRAIAARDITRHRNWMIRAYAAGIGAAAVSMVFIPIYAITGTPPTGLVSDVAFIGSWAVCVLLAEIIIRRLQPANIT